MIVITGASRGLGRAIAERMLSQGQEIIGISRDISGLNFNSISCDISQFENVKDIVKRLKNDGKTIKGLINAAGIASMNLAVTTPPETSTKIIETNLLGTIYCCQLFAPLMMRRKEGSIINFSTIAVPLALKGESIYAASKAGVESFSHAFAREVSDFNIRVNCLAPGPIDTDLIRGVSQDQINHIVRRQVIQRQFSPENICDLVEVLLDQRFASISGQVLHVGGV